MRDDLTDEEEQAILVALGRLVNDQRPAPVELTRWQLWCLGGMVQLACRHPQNTGPVRATAPTAVRRFASLWTDDPALARLWEQGWDPARDTPIRKGRR